MKDHELQEGYAITNIGGLYIIRPSGLKNRPASGNIVILNKGALPHSDISRRGVAKYIVSSMLDNSNGANSFCKG